MSIYKSSSLAMIPTAYKDGKLYSVRPTDGDGDFTFSRGSNLAATRVDVNGLIEKGRENVLRQSNQFDTTWLQSGTITRTSGQSGYDGTSDAWLLDKGSASAYIYQSVSNSGVATFSCYVKAGTTDWFRVRINTTSTTQSCFYDLTNGVIGTDTSIESKMESIGNGWYRCILTLNATTTEVRLYPADGNLDLSGTSGNIYIQDAQLEQGLVATDYIETGTSAAQSGILEDMPRLDYSGGSCPSLLLEPSRTNIHTNSEYVDAYVKSRSTITTNATTSPEGVMNASKVIPLSTSTGWAGVNAPNHSFTSGDTYTLSVFAKAGEYNYCQVGGSTPAFNGSFATINLTNGVVEHQSGITATTEDYGSGWYRISFTHTAIATTSSPIGFFAVYSTAVSSRLATQVGDDTSGVYMYGWQAEEGSYPTSYIPTYGTSQTRSGEDSGTIDVSSLDVTANYTLFYEVSDFNVTANSTWVRQNGSNGSALEAYGSTMILWIDGGVWYPFGHGVSGVGSNTKKAITYDGVKVRAYSDGVLVGTRDADKNRWDNLTYFDMTNGSSQMVNWNQVLIFPTALTDSECIALTTL